jgi:hypothetical protein
LHQKREKEMNRKERRRAAKTGEGLAKLCRFMADGFGDSHCYCCGQPSPAWEYAEAPTGFAYACVTLEHGSDAESFVICRSCFERGDETLRAVMRQEGLVEHYDENSTCEMKCVKEGGEVNLYIIIDGRRIAKRGDPDGPQARTWIPLDPDIIVRDGPTRRDGGSSIIIEPRIAAAN